MTKKHEQLDVQTENNQTSSEARLPHSGGRRCARGRRGAELRGAEAPAGGGRRGGIVITLACYYYY